MVNISWTTPKTFEGSQILTKDEMNTYVSDNTEHNYDNKPTSNQWLSGTTNVAQLNQRIESGIALITITTANSAGALVTFNTSFGTAPRVITTLYANLPEVYNSSAALVGTGRFYAYWGKITSGTVTATGSVAWMAIGA